MYNHAPQNYACPFCLLVGGVSDERVYSVRSDVVYQNERVSAIVSSHQWPNNPGNVIVVPNQHYENIFDLPLSYASPIQEVARMLAIAMKAVYACDGISTRQHNEPAGNQDVWHYHLHVTPRYVDDRLYLTRPALMPAPERARHAEKLKAYILQNP